MGEPLLSGKEVSNFTGVQVFYALVTFGSSAVSSVQTREIVSFARDNAGEYTLTLPRNYRTLVGVEASWIRPSGATLQVDVDSSALTTAGTLDIETRVAAGTATDPSSGDVLMLAVKVSNDPFNDATV